MKLIAWQVFFVSPSSFPPAQKCRNIYEEEIIFSCKSSITASAESSKIVKDGINFINERQPSIVNCSRVQKLQIRSVSATQLWQWVFWHCLPFSWTTLRGKHCQHPIAVMGWDMFGPCLAWLVYDFTALYFSCLTPWKQYYCPVQELF